MAKHWVKEGSPDTTGEHHLKASHTQWSASWREAKSTQKDSTGGGIGSSQSPLPCCWVSQDR